MSLSPISIYQRLEQLRLWQETHEKLLEKSKCNLSTNSDYQTIEGLSAFDSTINNTTTDPTKWEQQIISPTKPFQQLLEEKLAQDPGPHAVTAKPKRPFLRKGSGLERFNLKPQPQKKAARQPKIKGTITPLRAPDFTIKPKATWSKAPDNPIDKINELAQNKTSTPEPSEQTLYEKALEKELRIFEALEERANNSSFCSTSSSVVKIFSNSPKKAATLATVAEKRVHWKSPSEDEEELSFECNLNKKEINSIFQKLCNKVESPVEFSDEDKWTETSSTISSDLDSTLKIIKCDASVNTDYNQGGCANCQRQLDDFELKKNELISDRNKIYEIRRELETKQAKLERELERKIREFNEEKSNFLADLEMERKKVAKEKLFYQNSLKDSQKNRPTKKEREEISNLKQEVADLRETLKMKEAKNGMTQARLRNQIKQLEKENLNLKNDVEKLTKDNAKLQAAKVVNRARPPTESKILHEINKNINKLTQETLKNQKVETITATEDQNDSLMLNMTNFRNTNIEKMYESEFGSGLKQNVTLNDSKKIDRIERTLDDNSKEIKYSNGNVKTTSPDGNFITMKYFNGDIKQTYLLDGIVKYYYKDKDIWQTTYADGSELIEFPEGSREKRYKDGKCEITLPEGIVQIIHPDGRQEVNYTDGSKLTIGKNGEKILHLPNGQKEIETAEHKRREYPDGTVKILYPDNRQETRYSNGRIRVRDSNGTLIVDTHS